jgi:hypothetical protein
MPRARATPNQAFEVLATNASASSTTVYEIRRGADQVIYCTCPAWRMKQGRASCKHLDEWRRVNYARPRTGVRETTHFDQIHMGDVLEVVSRGDIFLLSVTGKITDGSTHRIHGRELLEPGEAPAHEMRSAR